MRSFCSPEIIAIEIKDGLREYLNWIDEAVGEGGGD